MSKDCVNKFYNYLAKHKIAKDANTEITHTLFGPPYGKYHISNNDMDDFLNLYQAAIDAGEVPHVVERPNRVAPLCIDIDFRYPAVYCDRQYDKNDIKVLIQRVNDVINKYVYTDKKDMLAYVFEKPKPTHDEKNEQYKDGFHIVYPFLALDKEMRYLVIDYSRSDIVKNKDFDHLPFCNDIEDVFDTSVVMRNGWMMMGSRKEDGQLYKLSCVYDGTCKKLSSDKYEVNAKLLSVRQYLDEDLTPLKEITKELEFKERIKLVMEKYEGTSMKKLKRKLNNNKSIAFDIDESEEEGSDIVNDMDSQDDVPKKIKTKSSKQDIDFAKKLVNILSVKRAKSYEPWILLGWCLNNISDKLLQTWINFSKKCPDKYEEGKCEEIWKNSYEGEMGLGTLRFWASHDSPKEYAELLRERIKPILKEAENGTHYDVALVLHEMYKDRFKCVNIKKNIWYEFQNHRWVNIDSGYTLSKIISSELNKEFCHLHHYYSGLAVHVGGDEQDLYNKKSATLCKLSCDLKRTGFKNAVMEQCTHLFYDGNFEEKLDDNRDLLGFNNGVYDLRAGLFRAGLPEDYISFTVGYDYKEYSYDHPYVKNVEDFFRKVQPENDMFTYLLTLLSSHMDGHNKQQRFIFFTGFGGCHAKGTKVIMSDGSFKNVEDVKIGDSLMGDDSTPRNVKQLFRGNDNMYKITNFNNEEYIVNNNHRLALKAICKTNILSKDDDLYKVEWHELINGVPVYKSKHFIIKDYNSREKAYWMAMNFKLENEKNPKLINEGDVIPVKVEDYIKIIEPIRKMYMGFKTGIEYNKLDVDISPYLLGYWLGNSEHTTSRIKITDVEIVKEISQIVNEYNLKVKKIEGTELYDIINESGNIESNKFKTFLNKNNLINDKHIPNIYLVNDRTTRLQLLAGLIDSSECKITENYEIIQKTKILSDNIVDLCRSLGFGCTVNKLINETYCITISGDKLNEIPISMNKKNILRNEKVTDPLLSHIKVDYIGKGDYYGFEVDKNHRYIMRDYTVTYNSNGKSTTLDFLQRAMGDYASTVPPTLLTRKEKGASDARPELADKKGVRFIQMDEPEGNDQIYVGQLKRLSGNDKILARALYGDAFYFMPQFKIIMACNKLPTIIAIDGGTWRRIRVTPWNTRFIDLDEKIEAENEYYKDPEIIDKMEKWKKAFMWLLLKKYYPIYRKNGGVPEPDKIKKESAEYQKSSDIYFEYISEHLDITEKKEDHEKQSEIFESFRSWHKQSYNGTQLPSPKEFLEYLNKSKYKIKIQGTKIYGIKFKVDNDELDCDLDGI